MESGYSPEIRRGARKGSSAVIRPIYTNGKKHTHVHKVEQIWISGAFVFITEFPFIMKEFKKSGNNIRKMVLHSQFPYD